jgi:uncharacterized protein (TIGR02117 family)
MPHRFLAALCLAFFTAGCAVPQPVATRNDDPVIYVIERDWHTDIGLPVDQMTGPLASLQADYPGVTVLVFGFGERQFLVNREKTVGAMLNALLPSPSALLLTALRASPQAAFGDRNVVALHVSRAGLQRIEARIWQEFELPPAGKPAPLAGKPAPLAEGPYPGSVFYAARDTYDGLYTCNTWTAETLRTGGLPIPVTGVLFSGQVMGPVRWISANTRLKNPQR